MTSQIRFDYPDTYEAARHLQITLCDLKLLAEAYRRKHFLKAEWLGFGKASIYQKSKLFRRIFVAHPPHSEWWKLTELGELKMKQLEKIWSYHKSKDASEREFINSFIFEHC